MKFSERYGHVKLKEVIQLDSMDDQLRTGLWNVLTLSVWDNHKHISYWGDPRHDNIFDLATYLWLDFYKKAIDSIPSSWALILAYIRKEFYTCDWYVAYDFIEFVAQNYRFSGGAKKFSEHCNSILERNMSAYRFVNGEISQITDKQEIKEIEGAVNGAFGAEKIHIQRALELLSDRENPDYRNSVKESISAVESLAQRVLGEEKGTLGQLLKRLEEKVGLHSALKSAFSNLYGYASDEGGIRHALVDSETVRFEDAKFFLVTCSAFINLVKVKLEGVK